MRASVPQQRNKIPVISSSSSLHSSQALMSCLGNLCALCVCVCMCASEHERGPEKPQSENYVSSERIRSPRFSQGFGILLLSRLTVLFNVNTHILRNTHMYTLVSTVNLRCIQQRQRLMTRKTEIDFLPVSCNKSVTDSVAEDNQRGHQVKEVCECVEGKECQGQRWSCSSPLPPCTCHPFFFPPLSKQRMFVSHWPHCNRKFPIMFGISSCLGRIDVRHKIRS